MNHPEQRPNQIYMGNELQPRDEYDFRFGGGRIGWRTKTHGSTAYDIYGKFIEGMVPVFIEMSEVISAIEGEKSRLQLWGEKAYGAKENIKVWQDMVDRGSVSQ